VTALALDDPGRIDELRRLIRRKGLLCRFYEEAYRRAGAVLARCPHDGLAVELGTGGGFIKEVVPDILTSDTLPYPGVDRVVDATAMPFADESVRFFFLLNVFHHIPDVERFLQEATRCLRPGGRLFIVDQHPGWLAWWILKYLHHEPFDERTAEWRFPSTGPLSGANGALAWIVFRRDRNRFETRFPALQIRQWQPREPLLYWLAGGLRRISFLPSVAYPAVAWLDRTLIKRWPQSASFVDVEVERAIG
jgi:SAM-dependent methyltransferase